MNKTPKSKAETDLGNAPSVQELERVIDSANTLIDFVIGRNDRRSDILDGLNEIRSAAQNDIDDATGATY